MMNYQKKKSEEQSRNLWIRVDKRKYHLHVTIGSTTELLEDTDEKIIYMEDLEKRTRFEGYVRCWDIENQKWIRDSYFTVALKSLDNSSDIGVAFLNEVKSHLLIYFKEHGNLRNYLSQFEYINLNFKTGKLSEIARGLLNIHNSGNILLNSEFSYISDLGMCQPVNGKMIEEGIYGVLPYMAPKVLRGHQYTKEADIYSFGIIMNEFITKEIPHNNIPHDHSLVVKICKICKGLRLKISNDTSKLISDLIIKCWELGMLKSGSNETYENVVQPQTENLILECFDYQLSESGKTF
ncbi:kinase-like protein [Rhizophagus irregularis]|uniref:Kinase-like protein n=1 Tax=Rhizophagus irregularis TaxID=588596 RepID=A0A2N0NWK6_9GLOM|nr:kinase-like protein [Rhizophagus irregularis]